MDNSKKKTVVLIVGRTASGKDYLTRKMAEKYDLNILCSYATRPRRDGEGDTHIFISDEEYESYKDDVLAFTQIGDYKYFSTKQQMNDVDFYIVDPVGVNQLKTFESDGLIPRIHFCVVYIFTPYTVRKKRALETRKDDKEAFMKRIKDEKQRFDIFEDNVITDYIVYNSDEESAIKQIEDILVKENVLTAARVVNKNFDEKQIRGLR